jgi:hypothetical protein
MRKYTHLIIIWIAVITYGLFISAPAVIAANTTPQNTANNGQALEIAPPVIYLSVDPGQTLKTQILIRDISSGNLIVNGQVNNFVAGGDDGTPKILLDKTQDTNDPYSLVDWVAPLPSLLLIPHEIKSLTATITVPKDAAPGGHYGVIRFTSTPPSLDGSGVSLAASIGVLVLITVSGNITEGLNVAGLSVSHNGKQGSFFESGPLAFKETFKNTGNVHVQPIGQVVITDMFGKKLTALNVNLPPGNILPNSTRSFTQPLDKSVIGNKRLFGRYSAKLTVTYGTDKKTATSSLVFWVIPYKLIAVVIVVLIALFFLLRYLIKRYNRRILEQAQRRTQK